MTPIHPPSPISGSRTSWLRGSILRLKGAFSRRKRQAALVEHARALGNPEQDREHVGLWAFFRLAPSARAKELDLAANRFVARTSREPVLSGMVDQMEERMRALDRGHAERHLLAISGYAAEDLPPVGGSPIGTVSLSGRRRPDRVARAHRLRPGMLATLLVLFVVALATRSADPLAASLTELSRTQPVLFGSLGETVRGHTQPLEDEASEALVEALEHIELARTSLLGFHTSYDRSALIDASKALERVLLTPIPSEPLALALRELKAQIDVLTSEP